MYNVYVSDLLKYSDYFNLVFGLNLIKTILDNIYIIY